jgi:clan AA aspartic protease
MAPQHLIELEGIVDTGAIYSVVPRRILEELGIKPVERRRFKTFGGYVERDLGEVGIELMGRRRTITAIFGETDDTTVLGVTALESFGLEVDPVRGTLKEAELLMLTYQPLFVTPRNQ